eukprot:CAMPEP_0184691478 /NCGR_PEP_ID=MMETSP0313-20130426/321_1 /TAXON_ID=2792 /ORGANISM="Porphyridium aerugineum, Strain SAG 1380-2" /LENGTH=222 /DNA_ID=CAMNT_0027149205 /DNA_START=115 /DNA_END=783 /DNA_ORIENTATION=+
MDAAFVSTWVCGTNQSLRSNVSQQRSVQVAQVASRQRTTMISAPVLERKQAVVDDVNNVLSNCSFIFAVPLDGIKCQQIKVLKAQLPKTAKVMCVKNTLMKRAAKETEFEIVGGNLTKGMNMWFFINDADIKETMRAVNAFLKETKKVDTNAVKGGVFEGVVYDSVGVDTLSKLPSKQELYQQIAVAVKQIPTKVGRVVYAVPAKVARAIKLATHDDETPAE